MYTFTHICIYTHIYTYINTYAQIYIYIYTHIIMHIYTYTHTHIYTDTCMYIYIYGAFNRFPDFFRMGIENCGRPLKIQYVIAIHQMRWLTNFYNFRLKWTVTTAIGIHPTKAWLSQLVNFKNAIYSQGHFKRTICNKILF